METCVEAKVPNTYRFSLAACPLNSVLVLFVIVRTQAVKYYFFFALGSPAPRTRAICCSGGKGGTELREGIWYML